MTDLKSGRKKGVNAETAQKIANYFNVSVGYLLGEEETKTAPAGDGKRSVSDEELKFALWGDCQDVSDDDLADVLRYAAFVRERKKDK
jgi:transcriptional regulator with XRE-family HTH domain